MRCGPASAGRAVQRNGFFARWGSQRCASRTLKDRAYGVAADARRRLRRRFPPLSPHDAGPAKTSPASAPERRFVNEPADTCRIDVWLWRARFCKTRGLAARMVADGRVLVSRGGAAIPLDKPSRTVRPGDSLELTFGDRRATVRIEALGLRRGPAPEARALYSAADDLE